MNKMEIKIPYYQDNTRVSNSALGLYLKYGPKYFKDSLDGKKEGLKFSFLEKGTMVHEYLLQPDEFWKDYVILDFEIPKVKQQKDLCQQYIKLCDTNPLETKSNLLLQAYNFAYNNTKVDTKKLEEAEDIIFLVSSSFKYSKYLS